MDREEVVACWCGEGHHRANALGREGVSCVGIEFDSGPVFAGRVGFGTQEFVAEVRVRLEVVEDHRVDIAVVVGVESNEPASLSSVRDAADFRGFGEACAVTIVEVEGRGLGGEWSKAVDAVDFKDVLVAVVVEVVDEGSPSPMSEQAVALCGGVYEGVVWLLDQQEVAADGRVHPSDVGDEHVEESVVVHIRDIHTHRVGSGDVVECGGDIGEGAVVVVGVVA